jgi:Osmosensitive K+ channel histidine kinase
MNCVRTEVATERSLLSEAVLFDELIKELDNGLHAMAQPLTVLRGVWGAMQLRGDAVAEHSRYLNLSIEQIERLCQMLSGLRGLLDVVQSDAAIKSVNLWEVVETLTADLGTQFVDAGIRVTANEPEQPTIVNGDRERTEDALRAVLTTALRLSSPDQRVQIEIQRGDRFADIRVHAGDANNNGINSANRLNLALAEANTLSQRGSFKYETDPFSVSMKLPLVTWANDVQVKPGPATLRDVC